MSRHLQPQSSPIQSSIARLEDVTRKNYCSLFPDEEVLCESIPNAFIINNPMSGGVGGDGYWTHQDGKVAYLAVFDCMGHGHLASMMTRIYTTTLKKVIVERSINSPGAILEAVHEEVKSRFEEKENKHLYTGADMGIVKVNISDSEMEFAGAKMNLIQVVNGQFNTIKANRIQVGEMFEYEHKYHSVSIDIKAHPLSKFYLFSDGVKDLVGGPENKKLGNNINVLLEENSKVSIKEQKKIFIDFFDNWSGYNLQSDDVFMIGFCISD